MTVLRTNIPGAPCRAVGINAEIGFGDRPNRTQTPSRPQLKRLGDILAKVAFVDTADGVPMGWLSKGLDGWNGVRAGSADPRAFRIALRAMRFVCGGRP